MRFPKWMTVGVVFYAFLITTTAVFAQEQVDPAVSEPVVSEPVVSQPAADETVVSEAVVLEPSTTSVSVEIVKPPVPSSDSPLTDGLVSLDFQDADIKSVLKVLAYKSNMNIVAGPDVTGTVSIQLNDVPWEKALDVLLTTYGYGYDKKGNIITVTTLENLKKRHEQALLLADQEPLVTKTFALSFAKASDVIDSIGKMKTARGQINFDQRTNAVIVRDLQSNMELMEEVMKSLDAPTPQVLIEAKIVETNITNTENLGIDWSVALTASGMARPTIFPFRSASKSPYLQNQPIGLDPTAGDFKYGTLDATGLTSALEFLSHRNDTKVLSNPQIMTLNNQTAKIVVGVQYPLPNYTYNQEQGKLQISGYTYLDIGIIFEVTPHVNNAGLVTMDLNPKITKIDELVQVDPASPAKIPKLSTEEAKTKVMIRNNETLVIAGLISESTITQNNKIPFLGDIPWLGEAFKKKNDETIKKELIVFLTPHIITAPVMTDSNSSLEPSKTKP